MLATLMGLKTISPRDLSVLVQRGDVATIDVNPRHSWIRARVPQSLNLDPQQFRASDLPADGATALVFYCSNAFCTKAPRAARRAKAMGFTDVRVMSAGIAGWIDAGLPTESGETPASH